MNVTMSLIEQDKPIYSERVKEVLRGLKEGKTREEIAKELGYKTWKSMDVHMMRKNFIWDGRDQIYVPEVKRVQPYESPTDSSKAGQIVSLISKGGMDLRTIAQRFGFKDHMELAQYMKGRGYEWDSEQENYVKKVGEITEEDEASSANEFNSDSKPALKPQIPSVTSSVEVNRLLPILEFIEKHKDQLLNLLVPGLETGKIPRYVVPGIAKTKTVQMMNPLEQLVVDFSREKNISQREIFEVI
jgi:hypothetical protein